MRFKAPRAAIGSAATVAASVVVLTAGCTTVQPGTAIRDPHVDPLAVNTSLLDTGSYDTKPQEPLGKAGSRETGALVEARRMADVVLLPFEVDPTFTKQEAGKPFTDPGAMGLDGGVEHGLRQHTTIAGFMTKAGMASANNLSVNNLASAVLRMANPEDARVAVEDMAKRSEREAEGSRNARRALPIPDRPDTRAFLVDNENFVYLDAYTAHGPYLLVQSIVHNTKDDAVKLALAAVDKQRAALDGFTPTPVDKLAELPLDPTGLQARTLPLPKAAKNSPSNTKVGVYGTHGALHFGINPVRDQKLYDQVGVTALSLSLTNVYQVRDAAGANQVADDFVAQIGEDTYNKWAPAEPVPGIPASRCLASGKELITGPRYRCYTPFGGYVIESMGDDAAETHRQLAAQYVMLAAQ